MYYRHFELSGPPFQFTPSTSVLYLGKGHRECLAALEWALLHENCGFMLLTGETGVGKTTLLCTILSRQLNDVRLACVTNPRLSFEEIMRVLLKQLGSTISFGNRLELIDEFERIIMAQRLGQRTAIIIDEAQDLSDESLEDVRLLANCADSQLTGLQFVLMGQPELLDRLSAPNLRQIRERIGAKATLGALSRGESIEYVECRLTARGGKITRVFDHDALLRLVDASAGIPRRLNVLCHNAMLLAYSEQAKKVDARMADEVIKDFASIYLNKIAQSPAPSTVHVDAPAPIRVDSPAPAPATPTHEPVLLEDVIAPETQPEPATISAAEVAPSIPTSGSSKRAQIHHSESRAAAPKPVATAKRRPRYLRSALVFAMLFVLGLSAMLLTAQNATGRNLMRSAGLLGVVTMSDQRQIAPEAPTTPTHFEAFPQPNAAATAGHIENINTVPSSTTAMPPASAMQPANEMPQLSAAPQIVRATPPFIPALPKTEQYKRILVGSGDTMHDLAERYLGSTERTKDLIAINPQIKNPDVLYPGEAVYLPAHLARAEQAEQE